MGGPVGAVVGAVVGGVAGGLAGKSVAESIDPTVEEAYWRETYPSRPYHDKTTPFEDYQPAYRYGWESRGRHADRRWDDAEKDLERGWEKSKAHSRLAWDRAKHATRDAWERVEHSLSTKKGPEITPPAGHHTATPGGNVSEGI
jgi:hypothetical protein